MLAKSTTILVGLSSSGSDPFKTHSLLVSRSPGRSPPDTPTTRSVSSESSSDSGSAGSPSSDADTSSVTVQRKTSGGGGGEGVGLVSGGYLGSDALQKLKLHYHVNKVGSLHIMLARLYTGASHYVHTYTRTIIFATISSGIPIKLFLIQLHTESYIL